MKWSIRFHPDARIVLHKVPRSEIVSLMSAIEELEGGPAPEGWKMVDGITGVAEFTALQWRIRYQAHPDAETTIRVLFFKREG